MWRVLVVMCTESIPEMARPTSRDGQSSRVHENGTQRWEMASNWRSLPTPSPATACPPRAAFVCIVSGDELVPQALCLASQLRRVGNTCPTLLVYDDRPAQALSAPHRTQLTLAYTRIYPSSHIFDQANLTDPTGSAHQTATDDIGGNEGRRLFTNADAYVSGTMMPKLFLWGMEGEWDRLVFLDLDLLILKDVRALLSVAFTGPLAAVDIPGCQTPFAQPAFNGGVLALRPNRQALSQLLLRVCHHYVPKWASHAAKVESGELTPRSFWRHTKSRQACNAAFLPHGVRFHGRSISVGKACERHLTDQSFLNYNFRSRAWLPYGYNSPAQWQHPPPVPIRDMSIIHYASEPKPWNAAVRTKCAQENAHKAGQRMYDSAHLMKGKWTGATTRHVRTALQGQWLRACEHFLPPMNHTNG